ncbi:hypothetical protein M3610_13500 [Neobacillus sp. MER 74]|uniref:hypothetical protein n=1 Tax=Neobacillus sp. MER 74 TaxID=2939566 RepID=UPI00203C05C4|nr:hypothetical protein [Neobacillus sp. MER 74]MCM3116315.1 hypothetical protein [Neobacillus sp. MER 74]
MDTKKSKRQEIIREIISEDPNVDSQDYLIYVLEKKYGISVKQSTISKDLKEIGARSDRRTGKIVFESDIIIKNAKEKVISLLERSELQVIGNEFSPILIKVNEKYVHLVANEIVEYFNLIEIPIYAFPGINGVIQILTPIKYLKRVEEHIKKIPLTNK